MLRFPVPRVSCRIVSVCFALVVLAAIGRGTTVVPPEFPQLVSGSDCIVRAVVKSVSSVKKSRAPGRSAKIFTEVELQVTEVIAGNPPANLTLEMLGGRVGNQELTVEGAPQFHVGDEDILFVSGNGQNLSPLRGMMYGRYPILKDAATGRAYVARADREPLRSTAEVSVPLGERASPAEQPSAQAGTAAVLSPEEFIRLIKASASTPTPTPVARAN